ncbi:MAG: hypothetical protein ACNS62_24535 [Candidatus Cyclobacteriaceae bacterium M3_2C_046]
MKNLALFLVLFIMMFAACERPPGGTEQELSQQEMDSVKTVFKAINDSVASAWNVMIEDDDKKLSYLRRLLQEITYTNRFDSIDYLGLMALVDTLEELRYDDITVSSSELIDKYDSATYLVIDSITSYAMSHPNFENYPLMAELVDDIQQAQSRVILYRGKYDYFAKQYNEFYEKNEHHLINKDATETHFKKKPLFELPTEPVSSERHY